ncbi:hypothetical protein OG233_00525 [Streptomyces sp. NBC_01218]|uniref:hypothetical protein n=1 Tax=unclassified Streptomyces TaxID=2593676 RepID=UPI0023B8C50F|nr:MULTISPECIES: hypothetical protein [unclassified Streptomyces]WEH38118.1 hypothetical protein PZB77_00530 [Streptomyces sp. AM 2-1-1]WSQ49774.1 hypothetical protein OG233_00525 [Streptomyces sp. NBC_01218]
MTAAAESGFEPATGDGPPLAESAAHARAAAVATAHEGLLQIRRLTNTEHLDPGSSPAAWELVRPVRAVALALEAAGVRPSAVHPSGKRASAGYRVGAGAGPGTVRVEWVGPPGSGASHDEEGELTRCADVLRGLGWTVLLYRGPRRRRFLEVEPPSGLRRVTGR